MSHIKIKFANGVEFGANVRGSMIATRARIIALASDALGGEVPAHWEETYHGGSLPVESHPTTFNNKVISTAGADRKTR